VTVVDHAGRQGPPIVLQIVGAPRSGSTVLARLLGQLDGYEAAGEVRKLWSARRRPEHRCGCGQPLRRCPEWSAVVDHVAALGITPDEALRLQEAAVGRRRAYLRAVRLSVGGAGPDVARFARLLDAVYRGFAATTGARVIVDSSKKADFAVVLDRHCEVEHRVVHLVRDPRGVVYSRFRRAGAPDHPLRQSLYRSGSWLADNAAASLARRAAGRRGMLLRYEDLVADPAAAVAGVTALCGVPVSPDGVLDGSTVRFARVTHTAHGNENRFEQDTAVLRPDDDWRTGLTRSQRAAVVIAAAPGLIAWRQVAGRARK
jgi:hypothetical protein